MIAIVVYILLTVGFAAWLAESGDRRFLVIVVILAWVFLGPLTFFIHEALPLSGGGDDQDYFELAATPVRSLAEALDLTRFGYRMEQPGYPWLLSIAASLFGYDLSELKLINLTAFILLALVWYRIGTTLETPAFGRSMALAILALTPCWLYFFFLRKDLVIALLQSIFLLNLISALLKRGLTHWIFIAVSTIALIPFRSALVMVNAAVMILTFTVGMISGQKAKSTRFVQFSLSMAAAAGLLVLAANPESIALFGVTAQHRIIGSEEMLQMQTYESSSALNAALFPIIYLLSEVSGLNPQTWQTFDAAAIRGILALPWIGVVVPFFLIGSVYLASSDSPSHYRYDPRMRLMRARVIATPWRALVFFIVAYAAVSWQVGDTTRWRLPDMPVFAAIAMAGWYYLNPNRRRSVLMIVLLMNVLVVSTNFLVRG